MPFLLEKKSLNSNINLYGHFDKNDLKYKNHDSRFTGFNNMNGSLGQNSDSYI